MSVPATIRTERLLLRPYVHADAPRVLDIHSRMEVIRWLSNPPFVPMADLDAARAWIDRSRDKPHPARTLAIEVHDGGPRDGTVAGSVAVSRLERIEGGHVGEHEVGWHLHPDCTGHGYVTEAATALLDRVLGGGELGEVWCDMYADNAPSVAVARRLGLADRGVIDDDPWYGGPSRLFHVSAADWRGR
ncbi:GNAT family N-acetyltransferase [Nocardioides panacisoli]|uniref:GNAT family N-acetyltransferase n=1 Tax=Nocardioides panacisoli TaxID=627624 RepID=UPI001C626F51|nr:GNAT family N-acetyltransferase [Nocardioides panacisoli]QYJ05558.1 GNAT family N-acetyltransferase [Nocardioides panacisoli]